MKQYLKVRGTMERVPNLEVNETTVYVRSNIERIEIEDFVGWQYDEIQYSVREYQELLGNTTKQTEDTVQANVDHLLEVDFRLIMVEFGLY